MDAANRSSRDPASPHPADIDLMLRALVVLLNVVVALTWVATATGSVPFF